MQNWLHARSAKLLEDINNTPYTDDSDEKKMQLIMAALRESSIEMFQRAAENSRKEIDKINSIAMQKNITDVEDILAEAVVEATAEEQKEEQKEDKQEEAKEEVKEEKPEPKIKLTSSVIRRVDSY